MKILSFGKAVCAAVLVAAGMAPGAAFAGVVASAPESDYPQFRMLADRMRLIDEMAAENGDRLGHKAGEVKSAKWRAAFRKSMERSLEIDHDKITDALMRTVFPAFSHEEIQRLAVIAAKPFPRRFQDASAEAFYTGGDLGKVMTALQKDKDYIAMPEADRRLFGEFMLATRMASPAALEPLMPAIATAKASAEAADTGDIPPPPSWDPPRQIVSGAWTLPAVSELDPVWPRAARVDGSDGMALIQCAVMQDGRATNCKADFANADAADEAAVAAVYEARAHVDPTTVKGGLGFGARVYLIARYKAG